MRKIMFNNTYGLNDSVLIGYKNMTRRICKADNVKNPNIWFGTEGADCGKLVLFDGEFIVAKSAYKIGEVVAIAQDYKSLCYSPSAQEQIESMIGQCAEDSAGWNNKMFVKAELMPHTLKITDIRLEKLQEITDEDCLREGVRTDGYQQQYFTVCGLKKHYTTPREAFAALINKTCGSGVWESNPYVFVYEFELMK